MAEAIDTFQLEAKDLVYTQRGDAPAHVFDAKLKRDALFLDKDGTAKISDGNLEFAAVVPQTKELLDSLKGRRVQMVKATTNNNLQGFLLLD